MGFIPGSRREVVTENETVLLISLGCYVFDCGFFKNVSKLCYRSMTYDTHEAIFVQALFCAP